MTNNIDYQVLDEALKGAGSNWNAAQAHGLLAGKLAVIGGGTGQEWLGLVLDGADTTSALGKECARLLGELFQETARQLSERMSEFAPLLPDENDDAALRTEALAHWSEGYLHGLVSSQHADELKKRLAEEPVAGIIKDMLAITQATVEDDGDSDANEEAYTEIVEYLRVAAQIVFEELAELRPRSTQ